MQWQSKTVAARGSAVNVQASPSRQEAVLDKWWGEGGGTSIAFFGARGSEAPADTESTQARTATQEGHQRRGKGDVIKKQMGWVCGHR